MERSIYSQLINWKNSPDHKPLMLLGARQVGKTYILKEFGRNEFTNMVYINCHTDHFAANIFEDFNIQRIIYQIGIHTHQQIIPDETLLFFDEMQEVPQGIPSLKYFCEDLRPLHVAVAGSLLGISIRPDESFPVGKVNILNMFPMTFSEFLIAAGEQRLWESMQQLDYSTMNLFESRCKEMLRQYYFTGGMPEAVSKWVETHDPYAVRSIHREILTTYDKDFSKHTRTMLQRIRMVWHSIPAQLAKENKKYIFGILKKRARAAQFEEAIQWLIDAGLIIRVNKCLNPVKPLKFYQDSSAFKVFLLDCGLLAALSETEPHDMLLGDNAFKEFKGAFTENYIIQQLTAIDNLSTFYSSKDNSTQEVDFLVQTPSRVIPTEAKAEDNVKAKSLSAFIKTDHPELHLRGLRCSMRPHIDQGWMENIPLWAVEAFFRHEANI